MKAVITTLLLLGSSTAAFAQPAQSAPYQYEPDSRHDGRDGDHVNDRFDNRFDRRARLRRPVVLARNVSLARQWNRQPRPMLIDLDQRVGRLQKLRIERDSGRMFVDSIVINYTDGHQQTVRVSQMLSARQPSIAVDLDHGGVTSMYVYASATRGRATFDVVGLRR